MPTCSRCGETIEFRYIGGRCIPLHVQGGGWACGGYSGSSASSYPEYSRSDESCCFLTHCPECREEVYFIRHNGGSVWIDPPLGWPWYKHHCMDQSYSSVKQDRSTLVSDADLRHFKSQGDLTIGIVKESEVSRSKKCSLINVETSKDQNLILLIKNNASFLVGRLVIYDSKELSVSWLENATYTFRVVAQLTPARRTKNIKCPECESAIGFGGLLAHMKFGHGFPRKGRWKV